MRLKALALCLSAAVCTLLFSAVLPASGQTFTRTNSVFDPAPPPAASISAISLADFNGDGRLDIYHPGYLYRQEPNGTFRNVLKASGIDYEGDGPKGAVFGDTNADGLMDLLIISSEPGSHLFVNRTGGKFELGNIGANFQLAYSPVGGFWRDLNSDGWLDFVAAYPLGNHAALTGFANGRYSEQGQSYNLRTNSRTCALVPGDYDNDGDADIFQAGCTAPNELLNLSSSVFRPRYSNQASLSGVASNKKSTAAAWFDYDNDGWLDLFVVSDYEEFNFSENLLYRNNRNRQFTDVAADAGISGASRPLGNGPLAIADFDNDGWEDVYSPENGKGRLFRNNQNGTFTDVFEQATGLTDVPGVVATGDFNNDGWMDLVLPGEGILFNNGGQNNWVTIEAKDDAQNRFGVGATIRLTTDAGTQMRVITAGSGGLGHGDGIRAHFGLGTATQIDKVEIEWPTGSPETFNLEGINRHYVIVRGLGPNDPPGPFTQILPVVAGYVDPQSESVRFEWEPSFDTDVVNYTLSISGPGVSLSFRDILEPFFELSTTILPANQVYEWSVRASDGHSVRYSGEERVFTFGQAGSTISVFEPPVSYNFNLSNVYDGVVRFTDIDGDGDLDLLIGGEGPENGIMNLYRTENVEVPLPGGTGSYVFKNLQLSSAYIPAVRFPKISVGDLNPDGKKDLIVSGISSLNGTPETSIYIQLGDEFIPVQVSGLPAVWGGAVEWGDMDGDGDDDLLISGATSLTEPFNPITRIFLNNGSGALVDGGFDLPGLAFGDADWADMDGDGDLDVALTGDLGNGNLFSGVFRNDGNRFVDVEANLPSVLSGSVAWADIDLDGDQDLFLTGGTLGPELLQGQAGLFLNENGFFTRHPFPFDGILAGEAIWGDYENDGDPDLFIVGSSKPYGPPVGRLFRNEKGQFAAELDIIGLRNASASFGDYNGDGDQDLVTIGRDADGKIRVSFFINQQIPELIPGQ